MEPIQHLVGKKIQKVFMNEDCLKFETDRGNVIFTVEGDCCSHSYFHDFIGVKKLLENGHVVSAKEIELADAEDNTADTDGDYLQFYGFEIVTVHPTFGDQTSVFSFRNSSNGFYGGWMRYEEQDRNVQPEITDDVLEASAVKK